MNTPEIGQLLRVVVDNGKYTVIEYTDGRVELLRHGEPWVPQVTHHTKVIVALACELEEAREKLAALEQKPQEVPA